MSAKMSIAMVKCGVGQVVVKTQEYIMCEREEGGNGGVVGTEAMLGGG